MAICMYVLHTVITASLSKKLKQRLHYEHAAQLCSVHAEGRLYTYVYWVLYLQDCGRGESNREQELCCTVRPTTEVEGALVISLPRAMTESAPARMGTSSWIESEATSGGHGFRPQRRRRCTIL